MENTKANEKRNDLAQRRRAKANTKPKPKKLHHETLLELLTQIGRQAGTGDGRTERERKQEGVTHRERKRKSGREHRDEGHAVYIHRAVSLECA